MTTSTGPKKVTLVVGTILVVGLVVGIVVGTSGTTRSKAAFCQTVQALNNEPSASGQAAILSEAKREQPVVDSLTATAPGSIQSAANTLVHNFDSAISANDVGRIGPGDAQAADAILSYCGISSNGNGGNAGTTGNTGLSRRAAIIASCNADAKSVETAIEAYKAETGSYPSSIEILTQTVNGQGPWLKEVPTSTHYTLILNPTDGSVYVYPPRTRTSSSFDPSRNFDSPTDPCNALS